MPDAGPGGIRHLPQPDRGLPGHPQLAAPRLGSPWHLPPCPPADERSPRRRPRPFRVPRPAPRRGRRLARGRPPRSEDGSGTMTTLAAASRLTDGSDVTAPSSIDRVIRVSTAVAVLAVAGVAAYVSYWHACAVVRAHGESGLTARLEPATIDGLVYASSMVVLYAARHRLPVPSLARWLLGLGIAATLMANMAQGWSHGPVGAVVATWPAVSLVGSYELLVWLIRTAGTVERGVSSEHPTAAHGGHHGRSELSSAAEKGRRTSQQACNDDTLRREDSGDNVNDEAVAAYQMSVQAGNPLSERKL